MDSTTTNSEHT